MQYPLRKTQKTAIRRVGLCLAAVTAAFGVPMATVAQDGFADAPFLFIDVSTGLRAEDNLLTEDEFSFDTNLSAGFFSATSNQRLSFETGLLVQTLDDEEVLTDPFLTVSYAIFARETELSFDLDYRIQDLDDEVLEDEFDADDLVDDGGQRELLDVRVGLVTGRDAPIGTDTRFDYRLETFSEDADEDDEEFYSLANTVSYRLNPQVTLRSTTFFSRTIEEDAVSTDETVQVFGLGADLQVDRLWSVSTDLRHAEIEIETVVLGVPVLEVIDGFEYGLAVTRTMRNGAYTFTATRDVINTGFQDTFRLRRTLALRNGAALDGSIGAVIFEDTDPIAIYSLAYRNEILRNLEFNASIDRSGGVSEDDENIIRTRLNAGLSRDLTARSSISLNTTLLQVENSSLVGVDTSQVDLALAYRHALTEDWVLAAETSRQITFEDGAREDREDVLSLRLERRFSFRP